jgi:hypothetical protein
MPGTRPGMTAGPTLTIFDWRTQANHLLIMTGQRSNALSRHHILLPLVYAPAPPKPKETRRRRGIATSPDDVDEAEEAGEAAPTTPARNARRLPQQIPVEAAERKTPSTTGNLSADTLKALLKVQEEEGTNE